MSSDIEYRVDDEQLHSGSDTRLNPRRTLSPSQDYHPSDAYHSQSSDDENDDADASENQALHGLPLSEGEGHRSSPLKRPAEDDHFVQPPFKRQRGPLNSGYLDLLNADIEDAALRFTTEDDYDLGPSQLGLTYWSSLEKRLFFEATGRLGRHNLEAIAARIETKSVVEVSHYMNLLREELAHRRKINHRPIISTSECPAAVELSQRCCHAQEEVADDISLRQERREQQREQAKWGDGDYWDIDSKLARAFDQGGEWLNSKKDLAFLQLFHLGRFL